MLADISGERNHTDTGRALGLNGGSATGHEGETIKPTIEADIHVFEMTDHVTPEGFYELRKHTLVTFAFRGIEELELTSFNHQNVLFDLGLKDISDRDLEVLKWAVNFASSFGVEASFLCNEIAVLRVAPFDPPAAVARPAQLSARPLPESAD
jgi:hypothetical protein